MAYQSFGPSGLLWPFRPGPWRNENGTTLDANGEIKAWIGRVSWSDGGSHTINTSGSSAIYLHTVASVFDDGSSVMDIGIQDVDTTTGFPGRPDGTYDVKAVVTTAADTTPALTTANSLVAAVPTTGTKTMAHGDLIAVAATFVTRAGSDSVAFQNITGGNHAGLVSALPYSPTNVSGSWAAGTGGLIVLFRASDGTWGTLDGTLGLGTVSTATYSDSSNPDEYGTAAEIPFAGKFLGFTLLGGVLAGATSDFQYDIFSDPLGTPSSLLGGPVSVVAESLGGSSTAGYDFLLPTPVDFSANTLYGVAVKATAAGNVLMYRMTLPDAGARALLDGGTTTQGLTRNGGSGAYTGSTTIMNAIAFRIAGADFPSGGGGSTGVIGS